MGSRIFGHIGVQTIFIPLLAFVLSSSSAQAELPLQVQRFEHSLHALEEVFSGSTEPSALVTRLLASDSRAYAFNVQALSKIYENLDPDFKDIRAYFKELEDKIGDYDRWNIAITRANAEGRPRDRIRPLERKRSRALEQLHEYLVDNRWLEPNPARRRINRVRHFLQRYDWPVYSEDRRLVLEDLLVSLNELEYGDYDMTSLESRRGMHQLRRDLRWFLIKARALNGFLTFREDRIACPLEYYRAAGGREDLGHYGSLPTPSPEEGNACAISACLFRGLVITVNSLGLIKDEAEYREALGQAHDTLDKDLEARAEEIYAILRSQRLLSMLTSELHACR